MNRFLATTAVALLALAPAAYAQETTAPADTTAAPAGDVGMGYVQAFTEGDVFASDLIGMDIYASPDELEASTAPVTADMRAAWDDIGEVNDILVSADGQVEAVLVDIGGFLGMGEHTVAVDMDRIHLMMDENGARFAAITATKESLEAAPEFERPDMATPAADTDTMGAAPPATGPAPTGTMAAGDFTAPEGYTAMAPADLTAERLDGATIYGPGDETIGTISELVLDPDGKVTQAVVDVGGFLGMGAHTVALDFAQLNVVHNAETDEVRVYSDATKEELEQMPEYEG